jgi:hypothetical protein
MEMLLAENLVVVLVEQYQTFSEVLVIFLDLLMVAEYQIIQN